MTTTEDARVAAAGGTDPAAFAALVAPVWPRVIAVVARMVGNDDAEDVVQEAVLRGFLSFSSLRDQARFDAWVCGVAVNVAKMWIRSRAAEARAVAAADLSTSGQLTVDESGLLEVVRDAVAVLPAAQRDVVLLHYIDDLSCEEVANVLGVSPGAVRVRLHRARGELRRRLAPHAPVPLDRGRKELAMIEVRVEDVVVFVGHGEAPNPVDQKAVVLLRERHGTRRMPIVIGLGEAMDLVMHRAEALPRPATADLAIALLRAAGGRIDSVAITTVRDNTFYAVVSTCGDEIDARPSDAINLAVRASTPILVADGLLNDHDLGGLELLDKLTADAASSGLEIPHGAYKSLSAELVYALLPGVFREEES